MRYAVVAQACSSSPLRSSAMVRIAVATMVWSRAARNMPIISPTRIVTIWRWVRGPSGRAGAAAAMSVLRGVRVVGRAGGGGIGAGAAGGLFAHVEEGGAEALEVGGEVRGVVVVPVGEQGGEPLVARVLDPGDQGLALGAQPDDLRAPVLGVADLLEQAVGRQRRDLSADRRHVGVD